MPLADFLKDRTPVAAAGIPAPLLAPGLELTDALRNIGSVEDVPPLTVQQVDGDKNIFRASGVGDLCAREEVLAAVHDITRKKTVDPILRTIFDTGTALHEMVRGYLGPLGVLVGTWACVKCGKKYGKSKEERIQVPAACTCKATEFTYVEEYAKDTEHKIGGHCDGFLAFQKRPAESILEIKSIGAGSMQRVVKEPYMKHTIQAQIYMWLFEFRRAKILYVAKDWSAAKISVPELTSPFLEHNVEWDDVLLAAIKKKLKDVLGGVKNQVVPARIVCGSPTDWRAKDCALRGQCFAP
jgi:hypothetical protein